MTGFEEKNGVLHCEDVSLIDIAEKMGTPTYVYSAGHIRAQYDALAGALNNALKGSREPLMCYACKANSNVAILSLLKNMGSGLEVVSEGELRRGLKAGFDPSKIVSTGVGKQKSEIQLCLEAGIHQINIESIPELYHIDEIATAMGKVADVVFRVNPDVSGGGHHKISTGRRRDKFGISMERAIEAYELAKDMKGINVVGLSVHIGSQVFTVDSFRQAFEKFPALVKDIRAAGHTVERLDIGGGFPIRYNDEGMLNLDAYARWVADFIEPLDTQIITEPGRYLVGNAGVLLTNTLYVKDTQEDFDFLVLDAAMNDLIRPSLYDAYHGIEPVTNRDRPHKEYDIVGPICETGDTFAQGRILPEMKAGELAVISSAGAYGACMSSNYNTRPLPAEVLVHENSFEIIRPRQSYQDIIEKETIPSWLSE